MEYYLFLQRNVCKKYVFFVIKNVQPTFLFHCNPKIVSHWDLNSGPPENRWQRLYLLVDHSMRQCNLVRQYSCLKYNASLSLLFASIFTSNEYFTSFVLSPHTDLEQTKAAGTIPAGRFRFCWWCVISNPNFSPSGLYWQALHKKLWLKTKVAEQILQRRKMKVS